MMKKRIVCVLLLAVMALSLAACGAGGDDGKDAVKDVPVEDLAAAVIKAVDMKDSLAESDRLFAGYTGHSPEELGDHAIYITNIGTGIDQFGILKAGDLSKSDLKDAAKTYLEKLAGNDLNNSYFPEEMSKLDDAEVKTVGDYVMYCVMSPENNAIAFEAFENALK